MIVPHQIISWPNIRIYLTNVGSKLTSDLEHISQEGTPWLIKQEMAKHTRSLPSGAGLSSLKSPNLPEDGSSPKVTFPSLTFQRILKYTDAYFSTFNVLYPILDHDAFLNDTVTTLLRHGYGEEDTGNAPGLLVFALGEVAVEGTLGKPIMHQTRLRAALGRRHCETSRPRYIQRAT
jgi:hypothetical protein